MLDAAFYDLTQEAGGAILACWQRARMGRNPSADPLLAQLRRGYAESPGWFLIQATEFAPEPLTVANLRVRDVYASERIVRALLDLMASEGWLDRDATGVYHLTTDGRALAQYLRPQPNEAFLDTEVPVRAQARLAELLHRVIDNALRRNDPSGSWCLAHSRRRTPAADATVAVKVCQFTEDLNAFRDDAHMAAWRPHHVDGYEWESFALVCEGRAVTADGLFTCLAHRGYSRADYAAALDELARRGWLERADDADTHRVTVTGRGVRADVERRTDECFYAAWAPLTDSEISEIRAVFVELRDRLSR